MALLCEHSCQFFTDSLPTNKTRWFHWRGIVRWQIGTDDHFFSGSLPTKWCPSSIAKLVQITPITRTYGRYIMIYLWFFWGYKPTNITGGGTTKRSESIRFASLTSLTSLTDPPCPSRTKSLPRCRCWPKRARSSRRISSECRPTSVLAGMKNGANGEWIIPIQVVHTRRIYKTYEKSYPQCCRCGLFAKIYYLIAT